MAWFLTEVICAATMSRRNAKDFRKAKQIDSLFRVVVFDDMTYHVSDTRMTPHTQSSLDTKLLRHSSNPASTYTLAGASDKATATGMTCAHDVSTPDSFQTSWKADNHKYKVHQQESDVKLQESDGEFHEALGACTDGHRPKPLYQEAKDHNYCGKSSSDVTSDMTSRHLVSGEVLKQTNIKAKMKDLELL